MKRIVSLILLLNCSYAAAEIPDYIQDCMDCHGKDGVSIESDVPTIAGLSAVFIEESLFAYKDDVRPAIESKYRTNDTNRPATDMKKVTEPFTDEQITEISEFFASKTFVAATQEYEQGLVKAGKSIHDKKCKKCHEEGGSSAEDDSGILAGQWTPYLRESMKHYRNGSREMEKKMKKKVDQLSDKECKALMAYYASQQD